MLKYLGIVLFNIICIAVSGFSLAIISNPSSETIYKVIFICCAVMISGTIWYQFIHKPLWKQIIEENKRKQ